LPVKSWLPNLLSASRLVLAPPVVYAIVNGRWPAAAVLLAVAALTDGLDGMLARRWNASSRLGAYLDPIADKVLLSGAFLALGFAGALPWWLVGLVFGRDLLILMGVLAILVLHQGREFPPSGWGKLSTGIQVVTGAAGILARAWPERGLGPAVAALVWVAALATVWSGLDYARRALHQRHPGLGQPHRAIK
jgi:cardiolipin synthase